MEIMLKKTVSALLLMCLVVISEQQAVFKIEVFDTWSSTGPIPKAHCTVTFPEGSSQHTIIWEYKGQQLAVNGNWTADDIDQTYVQHTKLGNKEWISIISIYNTVKNDFREGTYTCLAEYYIGNTEHEDNDTIDVSISKYLPPPDYPKCSVSPSVFYNGDDVTFNCNPGDSNPPVNLKLVLERPEVNDTYLGDVSEITTMITLNNNNSKFVCYMTSDTYENFMRQCSTGPIAVTPRLSTPSTSSQDPPMESSSAAKSTAPSLSSKVLQTDPSSTPELKAPPHSSQAFPTEFSPTTSTLSTVTTDSKPQLSSPIIIGIVVGGIILIIILLTVIICLVIKRSKTSAKPSTNTDHPMDNVQSAETANHYTTTITPDSPNPASVQDDSMQVYSKVDNDIPNYEDATPKSTPKASNHTPQDQVSDQDTSEDQIPVYAMSSTPSPAVNTSGGPNKMTNDMPIYSQVQKDSGMVDNMIYEPARPM